MINETQRVLLLLLCVLWKVFTDLRVFMCFSFLLVFSCLVLSVFSTIPDHQKFANQGLFILVRSLPSLSTHIHKHTHMWLLQHPFSYTVLLYTPSQLLRCTRMCLRWFVCRWRRRQPCKQVGGFRCCWLRRKSQTWSTNPNSYPIISPLPLCSGCFSKR